MASVSDPLQSAALAAAGAAADGSRDVAYSVALLAGLGGTNGARLHLLRSTVDVGSCALVLTLNGSIITVAQDGVWTGLANADINTGTWVARIVNAASATMYVDLAIPAEITVSASLTTVAVGATTSFTLDAPSLDTVVADSLASNDPRIVAWVDPRLTWANQVAAVPGGFGGEYIIPQISSEWSSTGTLGTSIRQLPEPGVTYSGITVLSRVVDPLDANKRAILHRVHPSAPYLGTTSRAAYNTPGSLAYNRTYWTAFALQWPAWPGEFMTLFDVHDGDGPGIEGRISPHTQSPIQLQIETSGEYSILLSGCYIPNYSIGQVTNIRFGQTAVSAGSGTPSSWHYFIMRWRCARSTADGPLFQMWRAIGSGSLSLVHDRTDVAVGYRDTPQDALFTKLGLYQFDRFRPPDAVDSTMYSKGMFVARDEGGSVPITAAGWLSLLRAI